MNYNAKTQAESILNQYAVNTVSLTLQFADFIIKVISNRPQIKQQLADYFVEFTLAEKDIEPKANIQVYLLEIDLTEFPQKIPDTDFKDWQQEPGKSGRKDCYYDLEDGRLIYKARTGMRYVQSAEYHIAYGPCLANESQMINFVLAQHATYLQHQGAVVCHSSAVAKDGKGISISAYSGGGKSTLALKLMNRGLDFVSNDRLFVKLADGLTSEEQSDNSPCAGIMHGIAKQPRINPGTIVNNESLLPLMTEQQVQTFRAMDKAELWQLEDKYDALIHQLFGAQSFKLSAKINAVVILNWSHNTDEPTQMHNFSLNQKPELLDAIVKSPGVFHYDTQDNAYKNQIQLDRAPYIDVFKQIKCYEITGKVDFAMAEKLCMELIGI